MIKVYFELSQELPGVPLIASYMNYDAFYRNAPFLKRAFSEIKEQFVERVQDPQEADFIVLPYLYEHLFERQSYIAEVRAFAQKHEKKLLVFTATDYPFDISWPEALVFRTSAYRSALKQNEFITPPVVEDLLKDHELAVRPLPSVPSIGFVGWAGFSSLKQAFRSRVKDILLRMWWLVRGVRHNGHQRKGVFLRLEVMKLLMRSNKVETKFIVRDSYSGSIKANPNLNVETARQEYIDNIRSTDMTLALRGDGNFSQRFYECLSLGRIPLFVDTDAQLPLEDVVPYHRFIIRVPYADRGDTPDYVERFFKELTDEEYALRQREARDNYVRYVSTTGFYRYFFKEEHIRQYLSPELLRG